MLSGPNYPSVGWASTLKLQAGCSMLDVIAQLARANKCILNIITLLFSQMDIKCLGISLNFNLNHSKHVSLQVVFTYKGWRINFHTPFKNNPKILMKLLNTRGIQDLRKASLLETSTKILTYTNIFKNCVKLPKWVYVSPLSFTNAKIWSKVSKLTNLKKVCALFISVSGRPESWDKHF